MKLSIQTGTTKICFGAFIALVLGAVAILRYPLADEIGSIMMTQSCALLEKRLDDVETKQELDDALYLFLSSTLSDNLEIDWDCVKSAVEKSSPEAGVEIIETSISTVYRVNFYAGFKLFNLAPGASKPMLTTIVALSDGKYAIISRGGVKRWLK